MSQPMINNPENAYYGGGGVGNQAVRTKGADAVITDIKKPSGKRQRTGRQQ